MAGARVLPADTPVETPGESLVAALDPKPTGLALLREPFPAHQISKLPKPFSSESKKGNCPECGGYHGLPAVHLDYVGHAALTDRLLEADPHWNWEPLALGPDGLPALDANGGLWIRLTVCGQTRLGYGHAGAKRGGDAVKELIGDALRNAAMRFGAALDLWHKGDLHKDEADAPEDAAPKGYAEWLLDFEATADAGSVAFGKAFKDAPEAFRVYFQSTVPPSTREALKAKARAADGMTA